MDIKANNIAYSLFVSHLNRLREPRSPEYKAGVLVAQRDRENQTDSSPIRHDPTYTMGTTQCDAWAAGIKRAR